MIDCKTSHAVLTLTKIIQFNADAIRLFLFGLSVTSTKQQSRTFAYSLVTAEELEITVPSPEEKDGIHGKTTGPKNVPEYNQLYLHQLT